MQIFAVCILIITHGSLSIRSMKVSPCARWNKTGITVAGTSDRPGNSSNQLNGARGIFIRKSANTLYVADRNNNRIQMFALNQLLMMGTTVASTGTAPYKIYIDDENGPTIYVSLRDSNRTEKWINGALSGIQVTNECYGCDGIAVDKEKNVYMVEGYKNRVLKWSSETNTTTVVAGRTDSNSSVGGSFLFPQGIYIDKNDYSLYVADSMHDQIQRWPKDAKEGITVAGEFPYKPGSDTRLLRCPNAVLVDEEIDMIYIVDSCNYRIQRWLINATKGETIVDQIGFDGQLGDPTDLAFDNDGNLYVSDPKHHHVQMFKLIDNGPCSTMSTGTTTPKNRAISSHENRYYWINKTIISLSISLWSVTMFK